MTDKSVPHVVMFLQTSVHFCRVPSVGNELSVRRHHLCCSVLAT